MVESAESFLIVVTHDLQIQLNQQSYGPLKHLPIYAALLRVVVQPASLMHYKDTSRMPSISQWCERLSDSKLTAHTHSLCQDCTVVNIEYALNCNLERVQDSCHSISQSLRLPFKCCFQQAWSGPTGHLLFVATNDHCSLHSN